LRGIGWRLVGGKDVPWPSSRAVGPHGWVQAAAFLLAGILVLLFALGLRRALPAGRWSTTAFVLVLLAGAALTASAFPVDSSMISTGSPSTWHGIVHGVAFLVLLPCLLLAPLAAWAGVRRAEGWTARGRLSLAATPVMVALLAVPLGAVAFFLVLAVAFTWPAVLARSL
jgi:hypothetical protein